MDLYQQALERFSKEPAKALAFATKPIGAVPAGMKTNELAACTVVANVLLNMDETLAKR